LIVSIIFGLTLATDAFGQAQITTRKEKLKDFTSKVTKVVLSGDPFIDEALKESVSGTWTISPYEFCTSAEFDQLKGNAGFYFLLVVKGQFRKEKEPGIDMLTLVKGGEGASKSVSDMLEVVTFPLRASVEPSGREVVLLPAILKIMQEHTQGLLGSELKAYSGIGAGPKDVAKLWNKQIFFCEEDLAPGVDAEDLQNIDEDMIVMEDSDDVDEVFNNANYNAAVSFVVAPSEPTNGSMCYTIIIGADTHELYYFKKHKITAKSGAGFLPSDLKAIKTVRK